MRNKARAFSDRKIHGSRGRNDGAIEDVLGIMVAELRAWQRLQRGKRPHDRSKWWSGLRMEEKRVGQENREKLIYRAYTGN